MKKTVIFVISALLVLAFALSAYAENDNRLCDFADLLTDEEEAEVKEKLDCVSEKNQLDVVVVTTNDTDGKSSEAYADDFYDDGGYGYGDNFDTDGVLLLVNMDERELWISTSGKGMEIVTDYGIEEIFDRIIDYASDGDYKSVFIGFADACDEFTERYEEGNPFDIYYPSYDEDSGYYDPYGNYVSGDEPTKSSFNPASCGILSFIVGIITSLISTSVMKGKLKSVASQYSAAGYAEPKGLALTEKRDTFLYSNVVRTAIPRDTSRSGSGGHYGGSSIHTSSGGHSHGGGGRHF